MKEGKVYFKGLHALRFIAAVLVLVSHVEMIKGGLKISNIYSNGSFLAHSLESLGPLGVTFFFVLSGFLITYLLLAEKQRTSTINVKAFYMRRVLRIWPVYILFTLLAFYVLPEFAQFQHFYLSPHLANEKGTKFLMYLVFLPGLVLAMFESVPWAGHLWSIGVEEQFYLAWPWLVKIKRQLKVKHFMRILFFIILLKGLFYVAYSNNLIDEWLKEIVAQSKFECMVLGGMGAYYLAKGRLFSILPRLSQGIFLVIILLLCLGVNWFMPSGIDDIKHLLLSPMFVLIILGVSYGSIGDKLENHILIHFGNISYGFYLYHMAVVVFVIKNMPDFVIRWCSQNYEGNVVINLLYYLGSIILTIAVSSISYYILEKPFLRLKSKFAIVQSGK